MASRRQFRRHIVVLAVIVFTAIAAFAALGTRHAVALGASAAQQPAASDEATLRREVNAFMDQYWALFSAGQIDQLAERVYHPFGQLSNAGHSSIDQMKSTFPNTRKALVAGNYGKSNMPNRNICLLSPTVAIISGRGVRYLTDGSVMGEFGWTYTLLKGTAGWKMVSIYSHDPNTFVTCSK